VAYAPDGAILGRPMGGAVRIAARVLRASLSNLESHPAAFSLEGLGLVFIPAVGAAPYFLQSAAELHLHTRAGPSDQGAFLVELDRAMPAPVSALGRIAAGKSVTLVADAIYSHAAAMGGPTWARAVDGDRMLTALAQTGAIDPYAARLAGAVLQSAPAGALDHTTLTFEAGRTTLGPVALGAAPKVY
jgi:hypothetical protein